MCGGLHFNLQGLTRSDGSGAHSRSRNEVLRVKTEDAYQLRAELSELLGLTWNPPLCIWMHVGDQISCRLFPEYSLFFELSYYYS